MKKIKIFSVLIAAVFSACEHEDLPITNEFSVPATIEASKILTIRAVREGDAQTRTVRDESNGAVYWTPGDEISVFDGFDSNGGNRFVCDANGNSAEATFTGSISDYSSYSVGAVGDIVSQESAIVAWVSEDASRAMLISGDELRNKPWDTSNNWCQNHGSGWRMPTIDELTMIHSNFAIINQALGNANYTKLTTGNYCYWSSTVNPSNSDYYYRERLQDGYVLTSTGNDEKKTSTANYTRAVKTIRFSDYQGEYWGLYPYDPNASCDGTTITTIVSANQVAVPGSFATNTFPCIGRTNTTDMHFYNICGGIRFSVTKSGIRRAVLRGNNGEKIAGKVKVGFSDTGLPEVKEVVDGVDNIVLEAPEGDSFIVGQNYYFVVPPTSFVNGFTIYFDSSDGRGEYRRSVSTDIKRSVISGLKDVAISANPTYSVGDIIPADDYYNPSKGGGIVVWVSNDKGAVLLMSLDEFGFNNWTNCNNWCISYGDGWRMPRINELTLIHDNFEAINAGLIKANYKQLRKDAGYWSSTPVDQPNSTTYYCERVFNGVAHPYQTIGNSAGSACTRAVKMLVYDNSVDLGLSVCWARKNVSSILQWDAGENRYAWGETKPLSYADWSMYKWCDGEVNTFTKYCDNRWDGVVDNKTVLEKDDDVAFIEWGGKWRMPTKEEFQELVNEDNCEWVWTIGGYFVISKKNGNSIFLPAGGIIIKQNKLDSYSEEGHYWSSSLRPNNNAEAYDLFFDSSHVTLTHSSKRYYGQSIRPVCPRD